MTSPAYNHQPDSAPVAPVETQIDRISRIMRKHRHRAEARDTGNLLGMGDIKQMVGGDRQSIEGDLISLVARGDVEVMECTNGRFWRSYVEPVPRETLPTEIKDGVFLLQRQVYEGGRTFWFDAETYTNSVRAASALESARRDAEYRARDRAYGRIQSIRLVAQVSA